MTEKADDRRKHQSFTLEIQLDRAPDVIPAPNHQASAAALQQLYQSGHRTLIGVRSDSRRSRMRLASYQPRQGCSRLAIQAIITDVASDTGCLMLKNEMGEDAEGLAATLVVSRRQTNELVARHEALSASIDLPGVSAQQRACDDAERTLGEVGRRVRVLRQRRNLTLQELAAAVRLSPSMLSLVERGRASPSLTTLAALAHGFGISLTDLIAGRHVPEDEVVIRMEDQPAIETSDHVLRRVLKQDTLRKIDITHNEYGPGIGNSPAGVIHTGHEYGFVLEGELTVEVDGTAHLLRPGDLLSLRSTRQHKIWNYGTVPAKAIWFNVQKID